MARKSIWGWLSSKWTKTTIKAIILSKELPRLLDVPEQNLSAVYFLHLDNWTAAETFGTFLRLKTAGKPVIEKQVENELELSHPFPIFFCDSVLQMNEN